jgi:hypothetical protein
MSSTVDIDGTPEHLDAKLRMPAALSTSHRGSSWR